MRRQSLFLLILGMIGFAALAPAQEAEPRAGGLDRAETWEQVLERKRLALEEAGLSDDLVDRVTDPRDNRAIIYVKAGASGNGTSWANAYGNLHDALLNAGSGDDIWVAAGTYVPSRLPDNEFTDSDQQEHAFGMVGPNVGVYGGFPSTGNPGFADRDPLVHQSILDGNNNRYHIVVADQDDGVNTTTILDGFVLRRGRAHGESFNDTERGAAIITRSTSFIVVNCTLEDNEAFQEGGAFYGFSNGMKFINCRFINNRALGDGGAVQCGGTTDFINCLFYNNRRLDNSYGVGGAVHMESGNVVNCTFYLNDNPGGPGGALSGGSGAVVRNSIFWNNTTPFGNCEKDNFACDNDGNCISGDCIPINNPHIHGTTNVQFCDVQGGFSGTGNINANPQFVNPGGGNLRIGSASPCRNAGSNSPVPTDAYDVDGDGNTSERTPDLDHNPRIQDGTVDMGPYEVLGAPPNDNCANGIAVMDGVTAWDNTGATYDGPNHGAECEFVWEGSQADIWFRYTASSCGPIRVSTCNPGMGLNDTVLAVYEGTSCGAGTLVACNDDTALCDPSLQATLDFNAEPGQVYSIRVAGFLAAQGTGILEITDMGHSGPRFHVKPNGTGSGSSWADATSLHTALCAAGVGDEIWVAEGTYKPTTGTDRNVSFELPDGVTILGGFPSAGGTLADRDPIVHPTTLSGEIGGGGIGDNSFRIMSGQSLSNGTEVDGFTFTRASGTNGSAIYTVNSVITVRGCVFFDNEAGFAGAFFPELSESTIVDCIFLNNRSTGGSGGALAFVSQPSGTRHKLVNTIFEANTAFSRGGAFAAFDGTAVDMANCLFVDNSAPNNAGAIYASGADIDAINCTFTRNQAPLAGAIDADAGGATTNVDVRNSIVWNNPTTTGNAIRVNAAATVTVNYSCVQGGWSGTGGNNVSTDPLFFDDGVTEFSLLPISPCIDTGNNADLPADVADVDGDGDTAETIPLDLFGNDRVLDGDSDDVEVVDMGAVESLLTGVGLAGRIDPPDDLPSADPEMSQPVPSDSTLVFYYPGDDVWYANETGLVTMSWRDSAGVELRQEEIFIKPIAEVADNILEASYFLDWLPGTVASVVPLSRRFDITARYNSVISANDEPGSTNPPDITLLPAGDFVQFMVREGAPQGTIILHYTNGPPPLSPSVGFEVVRLYNRGFVTPELVDIGRKLMPPPEADETEDSACSAFLRRNGTAQNPVAWQRETSTDIWPIRRSTVPADFQVIWYRYSIFRDGTDLQHCWPVEVEQYTTDWPTDAQTMVVDPESPPADPLVDLAIGDVYCDATVMHEQSVGSGLPGTTIDLEGMLSATNPGWVVLRLCQDPCDSCSDATNVTFEVIRTLDNLDDVNSAGYPVTAPVYAGSETTEKAIGDDLFPGDAIHSTDTPVFPFGYVHDGLAYNANTYPFNVNDDEATGQIFPVNMSYFSDGTAAHGALEVWYFQEGRTSSGGNFAEGIYWPYKVVRYDADWPASALDKAIVVASRSGAGPDVGGTGVFPQGSKIYRGGNFNSVVDEQFTLPGWNPNDEHAEILDFGTSKRVFAVRDDNPWQVSTGHPYVLVQYPDPNDQDKWLMSAHLVIGEDADCDTDPTNPDNVCFNYSRYPVEDQTGMVIDVPVQAGNPIDPLFPVNFGRELCREADSNGILQPQTSIVGDALWVDRKGTVWAAEQWHDGKLLVIDPGTCIDSNGSMECAGGINDGAPCFFEVDCPPATMLIDDPNFSELDPSSAEVRLFENWCADGDCSCQPWRAYGPNGDLAGDTPWPIVYRPQWPLEPRRMEIGETLLDGDVRDSCGPITVLHDSVGFKLLDPLLEVSVDLGPNAAATLRFDRIPPHLSGGFVGGGSEAVPARLRYDPSQGPLGKLIFRGIMSPRDREFLERISVDGTVQSAIDQLEILSRAQLTDPTLGQEKFLSVANIAAKPGYMTIALQNDPVACQEGDPVTVEVFKVDCGPVAGRITVTEPACPFSERLVMQHFLDAGGEPERLAYQWQYSLDYNQLDHGNNPDLATWFNYNPPAGYTDGVGLKDVVIEGASLFTIIDSWWRVRYRGYENCPCSFEVDCGTNGNPPCCPEVGPEQTDWADNLTDPGVVNFGVDTAVSGWTEPQLAEGWVKRVLKRFNQFDQRLRDFHQPDTEVATYVSMIQQAGTRYEGPIALNCDPTRINELGLIETYETVMRRAKSFTLEAGITSPQVSLALLLAASKLTDLYTLLGHEAYADANDPTIGLFVDPQTLPASYDPTSVFAFQGQVPNPLSEELALLRGRDQIRQPDFDQDFRLVATVYNRLPWNFTATDGQFAYANNYQVTNDVEARTLYPNGHGDAWGHYLMGQKRFYDLLTDPLFNWIVSTESVLVGGQPVAVGFEYERKFARTAAAKARAGALITALTFRQRYSADPAMQTGYPDTNVDRAWGVNEWARRTGQAALVDWIIANSLIDDDDTEHDIDSIQKVDRTTITELNEIAQAYSEVQGVLDKTDVGLNPLGLATNVVPFGLNPAEIESGKTHFDQVYERSVVALNNAVEIFRMANENTQRLRAQQDQAENFANLVDEQSQDLTNRLIEIFGKPYEESIGPGRTYAEGYNGPDIAHYEYTDQDVSELLGLFQGFFCDDIAGCSSDGSVLGNTVELTLDLDVPFVNFSPDDPECPDRPDPPGGGGSININAGDGSVCFETRSVSFNVSADGFGMIKPPSWGQRPEPGELQLVRSEVLQAFGKYLQGLTEYSSQLRAIEAQRDLVDQLYALNDRAVFVTRCANFGGDGCGSVGEGNTQSLLSELLAAKRAELSLRRLAAISKAAVDTALLGVPDNAIFGLGSGGDIATPAKVAIMAFGLIIPQALETGADIAAGEQARIENQVALGDAQLQVDLVDAMGRRFEQQEIARLRIMLTELAPMEVELYNLRESLLQAMGRYRSVLGQGLRLYDQWVGFRQRAARQITEYRYRDLAFRIFRNDALQKYSAQFDLAARYSVLAAKAYDYETNLLGTDQQAGQQFLSSIVRERVLGQVDDDDEPIVGTGLAGRLAAMKQNFDVLRTQLGFNNDALELHREFSLRWENFRLGNTEAFDSAWRETLSRHLVSDISALPEYRQFAIPIPIGGPLPGIVIPLSTQVAPGRNFFGRPSRGDEVYPTTYFAIKAHRVGIRFTDYPGFPLNNQAEVYLLPVGVDLMRVPQCGNNSTRRWRLVDQTLPAPNQLLVSDPEFQEPDWIPFNTFPSGSAVDMIRRRRYPSIPARRFEVGPDVDMSFNYTGRSVWNSRWVLLIPGISLLGANPQEGLDVFINGADGSGGVSDIKLLFDSYGYFGCVARREAAGQSDGVDDPLRLDPGLTEEDLFVPLPIEVSWDD